MPRRMSLLEMDEASCMNPSTLAEVAHIDTACETLPIEQDLVGSRLEPRMVERPCDFAPHDVVDRECHRARFL